MNGHREEQEVMTARLRCFLAKNTFPKVPSGNKQSTASCLRRLRVFFLSFFSVKRHLVVLGTTLVSCFLVSVRSLAFFCQAEKHSWIRTTSAVTAPSTRQHKSFKIRFLVFSQDTLGVQKRRVPCYSRAASPVASPAREVSGRRSRRPSP